MAIEINKDPSIHYAVLMETNGEEHESWYNFIRYEGNEKALDYLQDQLSKVDFVIIDDLSTFDLETKHLVSMQTAREMCKVDLNPFMFHRKFDGKLHMINFNFSKNDRNKDRIRKVNKLLNRGDIENYIDIEDPCDSDYSEPSDFEQDDYDSYSDHSDHSDDSYDSDSHSDRSHSDRSHSDRSDDDSDYKKHYKNEKEKKDDKKDEKRDVKDVKRDVKDEKRDVKDVKDEKKKDEKRDVKDVKDEKKKKNK